MLYLILWAVVNFIALIVTGVLLKLSYGDYKYVTNRIPYYNGDARLMVRGALVNDSLRFGSALMFNVISTLAFIGGAGVDGISEFARDIIRLLLVAAVTLLTADAIVAYKIRKELSSTR